MRAFLRRPLSAAIFLLAALSCGKDDTSKGSPGVSFGRSDAGGSSGSLPPGTPPGSPDASAPTRAVDVTRETMTFGGNERIYYLGKPKHYDANKSYPVVMLFHGNPADAEGMAKFFPFDAVSGEEAVLVYPQAATPNGDVAGVFDWTFYTPPDDNPDMNFIQALIDEVKTKKANIDKSKVLGFGYSGGAFFVAQYGCAIGGVFKAIAVNSGGGPDDPDHKFNYPKRSNGCLDCPAGPIPTIVTHGMNDDLVTVDSGQFTADCYAAQNGCGDSSSATTPAPCELQDGCPTNAPVKKCFIPNWGHNCWDGAMKEAWAFFKSLP